MDGVHLLLEKIKTYLKDHHLDGLIVAHADEYLGEYLTPDKKRLQALTGFTGSAGLAVVTAQENVLFVDSRYTIQARRQTSFDVFEVPRDTTPLKWLAQHAAGKIIGFHADTHSAAFVLNAQKELKKSRITLIPLEQNVVDLFWVNKPASMEPKPMDYDVKYAGMTAAQKIASAAQKIKQAGFDAAFISSVESVSWLLNKRDMKNPECPLYYERGIIYADGRYDEWDDQMATALKGKKVMVDFASVPYHLYQQLSVAKLTDKPDIVAALKAVKNKVEIENLRQACLFESQVICRFLAFVETQKEVITEMDCVRELKRLRSQNPLYMGDSFDVIAASGPHAAQAHYLPVAGSAQFIRKNPLLLVDTGGQYLNGTTDMTRTICVGKPTPLMKKRYTQVLKGHIALALSTIKEGDTPAHIDTLAHQFLREDGVDYAHATGHGIGMFLSVHETPPVIHEKSKTPLWAGMVFSNEPAFYDTENGFGLRLENMLLAVSEGNKKLHFENLLFIPFDGRAVDFESLTPTERCWLKVYHQKIQSDIFPALEGSVRAVLQPLLDFFL